MIRRPPAADARRPLLPGGGKAPAPRVSSSLRAGWGTVKRTCVRIDRSWAGDVLALAGLITAALVGLFFAGVYQP